MALGEVLGEVLERWQTEAQRAHGAMHRDLTATQCSSHCCLCARCSVSSSFMMLQAAGMGSNPTHVTDSWVSLLVCD